MMGKHREPKRDRKQRQQQHAPAGFGRQFAREGLNPGARNQRQHKQQRGQREFDKIADAKANRILGRHEGPFSQSACGVPADTIASS